MVAMRDVPKADTEVVIAHMLGLQRGGLWLLLHPRTIEASSRILPQLRT